MEGETCARNLAGGYENMFVVRLPSPPIRARIHGPVCHTLELNGTAVILIYRGGCVVPRIRQLIDFI